MPILTLKAITNNKSLNYKKINVQRVFEFKDNIKYKNKENKKYISVSFYSIVCNKVKRKHEDCKIRRKN